MTIYILQLGLKEIETDSKKIRDKIIRKYWKKGIDIKLKEDKEEWKKQE